MENQTILTLQQVTKQFGDLLALSEISVDVRKGERIALIGPSGSGKSTLMNLLTRTIQPDAGTILLDGMPISNYRQQKAYAQKVGILRQQFDLVNNLSVIHNVLAGRLNQWGTWKSLISLVNPQEKDLAFQALTKVGLEEKLYDITANLSGGEQQRVAIARLLVQDPKLLLADEPVSSLDPTNARNVLDLLNQLAIEDGRTLIASMHSVDLSLEYFSRIIGIREGRLLFDVHVDKISPEMLEELYEVTMND